MGIYHDAQYELNDCFSFLKAGLVNNEVIWIMEEDLKKDEIRSRMQTDWGISKEILSDLEAKGDIIITSAKEWYYPEGKFDADAVLANWQRTAENATSSGKRGVRAFGDVGSILRDGFAAELVKYESSIGREFKLPFTAICAYKKTLMESRIPPRQLLLLQQSHGVHRDFGANVLEDPLPHRHIGLVYDTQAERDFALTKYLNEGLKRGNLCVYASIRVRDEAHLKRMSTMIVDFESNLKEGYLLIIDLAPYYISALAGESRSLREIQVELASIVKGKIDKPVRLVTDVSDLMFQNRNFDECANMEQWWHQESLSGSSLCLYSRGLLDSFPFNIHKFRIFASHEVIADVGGNIMAAYASNNTSHVDNMQTERNND